MKKTNPALTGIFTGIIILLCAFSSKASQDDTVFVYQTETLPLIDGNASDNCWNIAKWQHIDQVWINWGESIPEGDFSGAYKILWSSQTNMLYFLVKVADDVICDAYKRGITAEHYNFDILEVFLDEDRSGGSHLFDAGNDNSENAFAYHIFSKFPAKGETNTDFEASDVGGSSWFNRSDIMLNNHFDEFVLAMHEGVAYWEFSLKVYNDSYVSKNPEKSRVVLTEGKIMGLSLAYCDNDDAEEIPARATRDNFYGSVYVPEEAWNDHYKNADHFGVAKLIDNSNKTEIIESSVFDICPNHAERNIKVKYGNSIKAEDLQAWIFDLNGNQAIIETPALNADTNEFILSLNNLHPGDYILKIQAKNQVLESQFILLP
ncbi:MAG: T9SS type A sorting domain-containing protein [Bacteroidales bacterium]|nr:T9SS type A sorting domain-containing protein [Bacteroidales bacterium]MBN2817323.1 T9SS type A sorting domain-containing protein [Bacteroidales bacterium]